MCVCVHVALAFVADRSKTLESESDLEIERLISGGLASYLHGSIRYLYQVAIISIVKNG